jgi:integrase
MSEVTLSSKGPRDTGWHRDGKAKGVYWRKRANGSKSWGYYADGKIHGAPSRQAALDGKAQAGLRKSAGLPAPDTRTLIRDLAEEVRESKRRKLRSTSFAAFEYALDSILLPELGHFKPAALGPDRVENLRRDLTDGRITGNKLSEKTIRRYLTPLSAIYKLALRRGIVSVSPMALLEEAERDEPRERFEWSREGIAKLIRAAEELAQRPDARYDYAPLICVLVSTGLRVGEALALRRCDVDLLSGRLHVRHTWTRDGRLAPPKTLAGVRVVPLSRKLVELFINLIPDSAGEEHFVFHARGNPTRPISYFNFRRRGFAPAVIAAGLGGAGITIHALRHAAVSLYASAGLTLVEVASIVGHADASVTAEVYARLFDRTDVEARVRAAQGSLSNALDDQLDPSR